MKVNAVLSALIAVKRSLPAFDDEAMAWAREHNLVASVVADDRGDNRIEADALTSVGSAFLTFVEAYAQNLLRENHLAGHLRRPETNGTNEDNNTNEQERHGSQDQAKQGKKVKDHGARYGRRKCPF